MKTEFIILRKNLTKKRKRNRQKFTNETSFILDCHFNCYSLACFMSLFVEMHKKFGKELVMELVIIGKH